MSLILPKDYHSKLNLQETEVAIKMIKDTFERRLAESLRLTRVSAPLFVNANSGLNDDLNGVERPVSFDIPDIHEDNIQIVHSLAKWKRHALHRYHFGTLEGLYTDMNAIRRDETLDNIHSVYVDQWDWELVITKEERCEQFLQYTVNKIYSVLQEIEYLMHKRYPQLENEEDRLPSAIYFITSQELENRYPILTPKQREYEITKKHKAVFISKIGYPLASGKPHDGRAPDYDDWDLNGDILVWYPLLDCALELSSMGIRVDEKALKKQLDFAKANDRIVLPYHQEVLNQVLPLTIGGGIGQSRLCMYFLKKAHIGEVQASLWSNETKEICRQHHIHLL